MKSKVKYRDFKIMRAEQKQKSFEKIKGVPTMIAYLVRFQLKELLLIGFFLLLLIVILQYIGFDWTILKKGN